MHYLYIDGKLESKVLGRDVEKEEAPVINIPAGTITCFHLTDIDGDHALFKGEKPYVFFSEYFAPGFDIEDYVQCEEEDLPLEGKEITLPLED